ncbi:MAG TPA: alpha/beta hydrolase [Pyrinomonadaceae bacterium]
MPSWQARCLNAGVKALIRRRRWGAGEAGVVRRARRLMGAPPPFQWLRTRGLRVRLVREQGVRGEWLVAPASDESCAILYIHGGGFVSCSPSTHRPITAALARLGRRPVFSLDYRLAPEHRFPAALDDALAAYRWLLGQGLRPESIALAGDSAGGGLVLTTLLRVRDEGLPAPSCAVCFSPWTDLAGTGASVRANDGRCAMFRPENMSEFASVYLGQTSPREPYASPAYASFERLPPLLLQVGSTELLLDDARRIYARILEAGGASRLEIYEDVFHCWQMLDGIIPEARAALMSAAQFIEEHAPLTCPAK